MSFDERLDLEFAYTSYLDSCRDLYSPAYRCRRPIGHDGTHASGFGAHWVRWPQLSLNGPVATPPAARF